jgi:hypothetical protein
MTDADEVMWMVRGAWVSMCLRAACELGVIDALDEPRSLAELATLTASDRGSLARFLRVLDDLGLVERSDDRYTATANGEMLRTGHPSGIRDLALMRTVLPNLNAWRHLADALRDGGTVYEGANGMSFWEWLADHPGDEVVFNSAMAHRGAQQLAAIRAAQDFAGVHLVVDVGGGKGAMVAALLAGEPLLEAIVADRPEVAKAATAALAAAGLGDRARGEPTDFFVAVPSGGDLYFLSNVLHDWDDEEATAILSRVREAMSPRGRLLIVETVLDSPGRTLGEQRDVHLLDLHMLVMFGARERTKAEYDALLVGAGFAPSTLSSSPNTWNVLQTRPTPA